MRLTAALKKTINKMNYKKILCSIALGIFCFVNANAQAATTSATPTVTTSNYQLITVDQNKLPKDFKVAPGKIFAIEFFSYGCPWCYKLDPSLQTWLDKKPKNVEFARAPVSFEPGWDLYQKIYYIAHEASIEHKIHAKLFEVAQNPILGLNSSEQAQSFFENNGMSAAKYNELANSTKVKKDIDTDKQLMQAFGIIEIPTVVITNGKTFYKVDNRLVNANNALYIATMNHIIQILSPSAVS